MAYWKTMCSPLEVVMVVMVVVGMETSFLEIFYLPTFRWILPAN